MMIERIWISSVYATVLIVLVLGIRQLLRRYSKSYCYCLWILVLIRLICPIFITSNLNVPHYVYDTVSESTVIEDKLTDYNTQDGKSPSLQMVFTARSNPFSWMRVIEIMKLVWLFGVIIAGSIFLLQYIIVKRSLQTAIKEDDAIWRSDRVESPFVFGLSHPRIYLPFGLEGKEQEYIIKHERIHIKHKDGWIRMLGMLAICLHWWNPMVWYGMNKLNQDMEMFCDETVLQSATIQERKEYATILLMHAIKKSRLTCKMAFGETNTERRIKNISQRKIRNYPATILTAISITILAILFGTIPKEKVAGSSAQTNVLENAIKFSGGDESFEKMVDCSAAEAKAFLTEFFLAVSMGQKEKVASMVAYPRMLSTSNESIEIQNAGEFLNYYDVLITKAFKEKFANWIESEINYTYLGMYLNDGEIWMLLGEDGWFINSMDNAEGSSLHF